MQEQSRESNLDFLEKILTNKSSSSQTLKIFKQSHLHSQRAPRQEECEYNVCENRKTSYSSQDTSHNISNNISKDLIVQCKIS